MNLNQPFGKAFFEAANVGDWEQLTKKDNDLLMILYCPWKELKPWKDKKFFFSFALLLKKKAHMTQIVIDKKKYVLIPERDYLVMQKKAALKTKPEKTFSIEMTMKEWIKLSDDLNVFETDQKSVVSCNIT